MRKQIDALARKTLPPGVRRGIKWFLFSGWLSFSLKWFGRVLLRRPTSIYFYPEDPRANGYGYAIKLICHHLGCRISTVRGGRHQLVMRWEDVTQGRVDGRLDELAREGEVINLRCPDISKRHVDEVFKEVFGYSAAVDPLTYTGDCVEKSNANGKADGRIVRCPLAEAREDCVYQILIDNQCDDEFADEMRVPVFGNAIPFIMVKYKLLRTRFAYSVKGSFAEVGDLLSPAEQERILRFCKKIGFDCGELDVLRDRTDSRIYIIDANNTPTLHFAGYGKRQARMILKRMGKAFSEAFEKKGGG